MGPADRLRTRLSGAASPTGDAVALHDPMRNDLAAAWRRQIERRRREFAQRTSAGVGLPREFVARLTYESLRLEDPKLSEATVASALAPRTFARQHHSRKWQSV